MFFHVTDAALMDVVEGTATGRVLAHVTSCARCRSRVDEARGALAWAAPATVPEPVPSYWEVLRRHVARRLEESPAPAVRSRRPIWAAAAVGGAALAVVLAVGPGQAPREAETVAVAALPAWTPLPSTVADPGLPAIEEAAPAALDCAGVADCLAGLTEEESADLAEALRDQIGHGGIL
jgi:hypothetical protein